MSLPVHVEPEAHAELREAAYWYEAREKGLGVEFTLEVDRAYEKIAANPERFPVVAGTSDVRRALLDRFPYAVVFMVDTARVTVIAVSHGRRKPLYWSPRARR